MTHGPTNLQKISEKKVRTELTRAECDLHANRLHTPFRSPLLHTALISSILFSTLSFSFFLSFSSIHRVCDGTEASLRLSPPTSALVHRRWWGSGLERTRCPHADRRGR